MSKIEEVKKILRDRAGDISYGYYQEKIIVFDRNILTPIAYQICQLFEPKPTLPLTQALMDIKGAFYKANK